MTIKQIMSSNPTIPAGRCYIVIGPCTWGKAFTVEQAWQNASKPRTCIVYDAPPDCFVDEMGYSCWRPYLYATVDDAVDQQNASCGAAGLQYAATELFRVKNGKIVQR